MSDIFKKNLSRIILPVIYIIIGITVYEIIKKIINKMTKYNKNKQHYQRVETVKILILNIIKYIIVIIVILGILANFGVNVTSLVAGLGVTTAIIGLAFQDLAKDLIAGISIITEAQYEVGDTIEVDGFMGEVEFIGLKTTRIRNFKGATKIIANRYMDNLINYSLHNSLAIVDVGIDYNQNSEKVEKVLNDLAKKLNGTIKEATGDIQVLGINSLDNSSVIYRITLEVKPMTNYSVERFLRKEIKETLQKANIKIPFPQVEVHHGK